MTIGWVILLAIVICYFVAIAVMLCNGGIFKGNSDPYLFTQSLGFAIGLVCSGIFLLFHYPVAGCIMFVIAALLTMLAYSYLKEWTRQQKFLAMLNALGAGHHSYGGNENGPSSPDVSKAHI